MALNRSILAACISALMMAAPAQAQAQSAAPVAKVAAKPTPSQKLAVLAERYYEANARFEPVTATVFGDNRFDDLLPMTITPAMRARVFALYQEVREELMGIDRSKLGPDEQTTFDLLGYEVGTRLRFEAFQDHLLPMSHMDSLPVVLANFGSGNGSQPIGTVAEYDAYLKRIAALPQWIEAAMVNMREGMRQKIVLPRALVVSLLPQLKSLAATAPEASTYYSPVTRMPASFSAAQQQRLKGEYARVVSERVQPALRKLAAFVENDYLPAARATSGWGTLPNGSQWYLAWVASHTTTTLTPDEIHRIGLAEMARINGEFAKLAPKLGYTGKPSGLAQWLVAQPAYRPYKTEEAVLQGYRDLNAAILPKLPQLFATLPKAPMEIRAEPALSKATASDHYTLAAADGSRPGIFWAVVNDPAAYGTTTMTSLLLHEAYPGHHLQLSRQQELPVPKFRKFGLINAYSEGWGLYAETLGHELGLYGDPNAYAGHLMLDMRRAARLVVDTGLHAKGWSREQTIAFLMDEAGDTEAAARNATERYMAWPGQALGYKIGALKIMALRQRAAAALGPAFSLARFHDLVLENGPLPLALLEAKVNAWIAASAK